MIFHRAGHKDCASNSLVWKNETEFGMTSKPERKKLRGRVLVVDDAIDGRVLLSKILMQIGLEVDSAADGQQGYDKAVRASQNGKPFDVVLMDMQMPVMDGFSATILLRSNQYEGRIVALTGIGDGRERCLRAGCNDFASKPIGIDALLGVIQRYLEPCTSVS
jgi:hypothetical protein